ncbi:hypothetical protein ACFO0A_10085 [Novosphingobium tardum]|jgi:hypothetical protein|uniref:DUF2059 domain-containing protein n=1 Tax=Novosphingobium tardum TaxID=1538021 RepID=A0ABV8RPU2_9SPHN
MIAALLLLAAGPQDAAYQSARKIAEHGMLATVGPLMAVKETEELVLAHPELTPAEKAKLHEVAREQEELARRKMMDAEASAYVAHMSAADLKALAAWVDSPLAHRQRTALPQIVMSTMQTLGTIDFKGSVTKAYCAKTGKLCPEAPASPAAPTADETAKP